MVCHVHGTGEDVGAVPRLVIQGEAFETEVAPPSEGVIDDVYRLGGRRVQSAALSGDYEPLISEESGAVLEIDLDGEGVPSGKAFVPEQVDHPVRGRTETYPPPGTEEVRQFAAGAIALLAEDHRECHAFESVEPHLRPVGAFGYDWMGA